MKKNNILYTSDINYFPHMFTSIYSLLENNKDIPLKINIIEQGFTSLEIEKLELLIANYCNVDLKIYEFNPSLLKFNIPKWRNTDIANARLFANEFIDTDKLLYLDSDTIIASSLLNIFNQNINTPVAAVKDQFVPVHMKKKLDKYYNSGVLLFNYALWNKEECFKKIYDTFHNIDFELLFPDQDLLNLSLNEMFTTLPVDYNIMPLISDLFKHPYLLERYSKKYSYYNYDEIFKSFQNPHIFHMLSYLHTRPWIENNVHPFNIIYDYYREKWDRDYEKEIDRNLVAKYKISAYINMLNCIYFPQSLSTGVKEFIKKKFYK